MGENVIIGKSFEFALRVVHEARRIQEDGKEYVLSKQFIRSGTAIGALVREAEQAESRADFIHKMSIALKEANETDYWIELLHGSGYLDAPVYEPLKGAVEELIRLLISIVKTSKANA